MDWFITGVEALSLDAVFPWIFSAWPDGFDGRNEITNTESEISSQKGVEP
jgi:hypothetical protein